MPYQAQKKTRVQEKLEVVALHVYFGLLAEKWGELQP